MDPYIAFYNKFKEKLFAYLMRYTGDCEISSDIMQESFTRYLEHYRNQEYSASLLYKIARNALMDLLKKQKRDVHNVDEEYEDRSRSVEESLLIQEEYRDTLEGLQRLGHNEREVISLVLNGDLSYKEIASIVGISEANVKVRVHRARTRLRELLSKGD